MPDLRLEPRPALAGLARPGRHGEKAGAPGIAVGGWRFSEAVLVSSRAPLPASVFGIEPPATPRAVAGELGTVLWAGPGSWLVLREASEGPLILEAQLRERAGEGVALVDQSDQRVVLNLSGPRLRDLLAKGVAVDLHPRRFGPGDVAWCALDHLAVMVWQMDATPRFGLVAARASIGHIWHWLEVSAAEYGLHVEPGLA